MHSKTIFSSEESKVRELIIAKFLEVKGKNPRYSIRALATHCNINHGSLAGYMSGRRSIPLDSVLKIMKRLGFSSEDISELLKHSLFMNNINLGFEDKETKQSSAIDTVTYHSHELKKIILPVRPDKIDYAKVLIRKFQDDMLELMDESHRKEIFELCVQLSPHEESK